MSRLPAPGTFISGYGTITRLDVSGQGALASGTPSSWPQPHTTTPEFSSGFAHELKCSQCGAVTGITGVHTYAIPCSGAVPYSGRHCITCAGFNLHEQKFTGNKNKWISEYLRDSAGFAEDTPPTIVADWYEDNGRSYDADWLRKHTSGL